jgi:hypothetical protein
MQNDSGRRGGFGEGGEAIVVYLDGSVSRAPLDRKSLRVMRPKGGAKVDIFSKDWGTDPSKVLNLKREMESQERTEETENQWNGGTGSFTWRVSAECK